MTTKKKKSQAKRSATRKKVAARTPAKATARQREATRSHAKRTHLINRSRIAFLYGMSSHAVDLACAAGKIEPAIRYVGGKGTPHDLFFADDVAEFDKARKTAKVS